MRLPRPNDEYSLEEVAQAVESAVGDLYTAEPDIHSFSPLSGQTEWNLAAHLAPEVVKYFEGYSYDVEVMKLPYDFRRPDIIIHRRGPEARYNLLVIEVKRDGSASEIREDTAKIQEYWFGERLRYRFGATINLRTRKPDDIDVFDNPSVQ
jgi:hypothetical protein